MNIFIYKCQFFYRMLKTDLEGLLEAGFHALGIKFLRRIYGEEVYAGASVDDSFEDVKSDDVWADEKAEQGLHFCHDLLQTSDQYDVKYDMVPFFKRRTKKGYNGFIIEYEVVSSEKLPVYENEADRLIREGKIECEGINIRDIDGDSLLEIKIPADGLVNTIGFKDVVIREYFDNNDMDGSGKIAILNQIRGKEVTTDTIYKAVIDFIS